VVREVVFAASAGSQDLLITDLPARAAPQLIRLTPEAGLTVGAFVLRKDRLPPRDATLPPDLQAAQDRIEVALRVPDGAVRRRCHHRADQCGRGAGGFSAGRQGRGRHRHL